ncbi:MAG: hypothetical protein V4474_00230 [Patescibacteria group bacterium]
MNISADDQSAAPDTERGVRICGSCANRCGIRDTKCAACGSGLDVVPLVASAGLVASDDTAGAKATDKLNSQFGATGKYSRPTQDQIPPETIERIRKFFRT